MSAAEPGIEATQGVAVEAIDCLYDDARRQSQCAADKIGMVVTGIGFGQHDEGNNPGILTDRDIRLAVNSPVIDEDATLSRQSVLESIKVMECMTPDPQTVGSDASLKEVAELLSLSKFGAMPVVDDGKLVGMISYIDFLKHYAASA